MLLPVLFSFCLIHQISSSCIPRATPNGFICVCNSTDCDVAPGIGEVGDDIIVVYTSANNPGFTVEKSAKTNQYDPSVTLVTVSEDSKFQTILGFGGAFTDAVGINIKKMPTQLQEKVLEAYFGLDGIEYNMARVPIGCSDFSPRPYSLDDDHDGDINLEYFALEEEDKNYKIPIIQKAIELRAGKQLNLFASAWTAPLWMKTRPAWYGMTMLKKEYYQTWANYHIKFFEEYLKNGIGFWGLTAGNEPAADFTLSPVPSLGWTTNDMITFIKKNLGPSIRNSNFSDLKLMVNDHNLDLLPLLVQPIFADDEALQYVDGVALHWYSDAKMNPSVRELAFTDKKDVFVLESETCHFVTKPLLGSWERANDYIKSIILDLSYGYSGWVEWNLVLNITGGPTHINEPADAPIVASEDFTEFYKQPTFYVLGHFSKFVYPESVRIGADASDDSVEVLAFLRPDNMKVVTVHNPGNATTIQIRDGQTFSVPINLEAQSLNTLIYENV